MVPDLAGLTRVAFLTLPNASMIALANAVEVLRMANYVTGREDYGWAIVTLDGRPATASNGLSLTPTIPLADARPFGALLVCGGIDVRQAVDRALAHVLRREARAGTALGALCTGTFALAEAGLLGGYRAAIHWENLSGVREEFPDVEITQDLFVIDRDRLTCAGGTAPLHMMLKLVEARHGRSVAAAVSDQFMLERIRDSDDPQRVPLANRVDKAPPALIEAGRLMERTIERPLSVERIAASVGLSPRQLERLFKQHLGAAPGAFYLSLRLDRARMLLKQSQLAVTDVGLACGFASPAHFSASYRRRFGHPPRDERMR